MDTEPSVQPEPAIAQCGTNDSGVQNKCPDMATSAGMLSVPDVAVNGGDRLDKLAGIETPIRQLLSSVAVAANQNWPCTVDDIREKVNRGEYTQVVSATLMFGMKASFVLG